MGVRRAVMPPVLAVTPSALLAVRRFWTSRRTSVVAVALLAAATLWSFWPTLVHLFGEWLHNPQYSHGLLVPAFSGVLLWLRRNRFPDQVVPTPLPGLALLAFGAACRVFAGFMYM